MLRINGVPDTELSSVCTMPALPLTAKLPRMVNVLLIENRKLRAVVASENVMLLKLWLAP